MNNNDQNFVNFNIHNKTVVQLLQDSQNVVTELIKKLPSTTQNKTVIKLLQDSQNVVTELIEKLPSTIQQAVQNDSINHPQVVKQQLKVVNSEALQQFLQGSKDVAELIEKLLCKKEKVIKDDQIDLLSVVQQYLKVANSVVKELKQSLKQQSNNTFGQIVQKQQPIQQNNQKTVSDKIMWWRYS